MIENINTSDYVLHIPIIIAYTHYPLIIEERSTPNNRGESNPEEKWKRKQIKHEPLTSVSGRFVESTATFVIAC